MRSFNKKEYTVKGGVLLGFRDTYLISLIDLKLVYLIRNNERANEAFTVFYDSHDIYTGQDFIGENSLNLPMTDSYQVIQIGNRRYMSINSKLNKSDLNIVYITPQASVLDDLSKGHFHLLVISLSMILIIPVGYQLLKQLFFTPLDPLMSSMCKNQSDYLTNLQKMQNRIY